MRLLPTPLGPTLSIGAAAALLSISPSQSDPVRYRPWTKKPKVNRNAGKQAAAKHARKVTKRSF